VVRLTDQLDMWIDDDGLYNSQPNPLATKLAHHFQPDIPLPYRQPYFGTAVLLGIDQDTGDTLSMTGAAQLTYEQLAQLQSSTARVSRCPAGRTPTASAPQPGQPASARSPLGASRGEDQRTTVVWQFNLTINDSHFSKI